MNRLLSQLRRRHPGSALVITLVMIVLISTIIVAYLASVMMEGQSARAFLAEQRANDMATIGLHSAVARLRDGFGPWDDPFKNFTNAAPPFFWSISPGRLTQWSFTNVAPLNNVALFSDPALVPNTAVTTNLVNLNRRKADGTYPIIGGTNAPDLSVKWINVLSDPSQPPGKTNQVTGRYAFWIDDECAKVNLNTADGTQKTNRLKTAGIGTPSEVSLETFFAGNVASNIVQVSQISGLTSPNDALKASGVTTNALADNAFNLTTYNRAPELNVFGEPRMFLIPAARFPVADAYEIRDNLITQQPLTELYPTPSQLPGFPAVFSRYVNGSLVTSSYTQTTPWNGTRALTASKAWPLVCVQSSGRQDYTDSVNFFSPLNGAWNYALIAKYLSGKNGLDKVIQWPAFPGTSEPAAGFLGKYSLRQLDSIAMQITDLGYKATTPDDGSGELVSFSAPTTTLGYLSGQLVGGAGRYAHISEVYVNVTTTALAGKPPALYMNINVEWFLPAGFAGVDLLNWNPAASNIPQGAGNFTYGNNSRPVLNLADTPTDADISGTSVPVSPSRIPPNSFWQDRLLSNDAGIDFLGNPALSADPDQTKAGMYHPFSKVGATYMGSGNGSASKIASIFQMYSGAWGSAFGSGNSAYAWSPGQYWCMQNTYASTPFYMKPDATSVTLSGGLSILTINTTRGDLEPVPMEAKRGMLDGGGLNGTGENLTDLSAGSAGDHVLKSVLPINLTIGVPSTVAGESRHFEVADPLVNKFPGDWVMSDPSEATIGVYPNGSLSPPNKGVSRYYNGLNRAAQNSPNFDPDSYWMPEVDTTIRRSSRFPSVGYLQYLRTGIVPDDEDSVDYSQQHGTPYRLLSFAPSTDTSRQKTTKSSSQAYPDWAMLDLFTIPSTVKPQGTFGGATSGRINPNGTVVYTTDVNTPASGISRTMPLQAVLRGQKVNQNLTTASNGVSTRTGGQDVDPVAIAAAIESYVRSNGPLRMAGEICNIPEIAALRPAANPTRNDLVRQIFGELTTQSNSFSVWVAGQAIRKNPNNTAYDQFQSGDATLAEVRYHFLVERYLDPGKDGVYGNSSNPGADGIVGTWDDLMDSNDHPLAPKYLYRVVSMEEVR